VKAQIQAARRARRSIEQMRKQLLCPTAEAVSACTEPLAEAIGCLETLQTALRAARPGEGRPAGATGELGAEIVRLRKELAQVSALLRSAAEFHEGYGRLLRSFQDPGVDYSRAGSSMGTLEVRKLIVHG
jgi:hypothetical protein